MNDSTKRQLNPARSSLLARQIRQSNARMAAAEIVTDLDEVRFTELVEEYLAVSSVEDVLKLVNEGQIPPEHEIYGTPIALAAELGLHDLIKPLHAAGCPVNAVGKENMTAMEHTIANGLNDPDATTLNSLLDLGATMSDASDLLTYAAFAGHPQHVAALIARGSDTNRACPVKHETPLLAALSSLGVGSRIVEVISVLLANGADPNLSHTTVSDYGGKRSRHKKLPVNALAKSTDSDLTYGEIHEIVDALVKHGMKIDHGHQDLQHPLALCMIKGNDAFAHAFLQHGTDPRYTVFGYDGGISPEFEAAEIAQHGFVNTESPFVLFATQGMRTTVSYLLDHHNEDPCQLTTEGVPVIDAVSDEETRQILRAAIMQREIARALDGPDSSQAPRRRSTPTL